MNKKMNKMTRKFKQNERRKEKMIKV